MAFQENLKDTLDIWDLQLVRYGEQVMERRRQFVRELNEIVGEIHEKLTGGRERLVMEYEPSTGEMSLEEAVRRNRERDYPDEEYIGRTAQGRYLFSGSWDGHPEIRVSGTAAYGGSFPEAC